MANLSQQLADIGKTNMETVMRLATISWDRTERLMQLQTETASQLLEKTSRTLDPQLDDGAENRIGRWSYPESLQTGLDASRRYLEATVQTQTELSRMWNEQFDILSKGLAQSLEQWARAISAGSEETIAVLQDLTARTNQITARLREQASEVTSDAVKGMRDLESRASAEAQRLGSRATEEARDHASKAKKSKGA
jgi:hypothetical protein